jgi:hypothetical protein
LTGKASPKFTEWCISWGLTCVRFPVHSEYDVLNQVLAALNEHEIALVHSKPIRNDLPADVMLVDATAHVLTARTALRQRIAEPGNTRIIENPSDTHAILSSFRRLKKSTPKIKWWVWWSPSDMLTQNIGEGEIVRCMRAIAKDFSDVSFLALVPRCVHTQQGLALLDYVSEVVIDMDDQWSILKHPNRNMEGTNVEC